MDLPAGCALCDSVCPNNFGTTISDLGSALGTDISNALRVVGKCLGGGGLSSCICNILIAIKPAWIDNLPNPQQRCSGGNVFGLLASKILEMTLQATEDSINGFIIDPINKFVDRLPWPLNNVKGPLRRACFTGFWKPGGRCWDGDVDMAAYLGCFATESAAAYRSCFFTRQKSICQGGSGRSGRYQALFDAPSGTQLENRYREIAGDGFSSIDHTFAAVFDAVSSSTLSADAKQARDICDDSVYESMDLDDIIVACVFHHIESFCPSSTSSESFRTFLNSIDWQLPSVVFDWSASPPPPPDLALKGPIARLALLDPVGFTLAEEALSDFFPPLEYVVSKSSGSLIKNKFGPK